MKTKTTIITVAALALTIFAGGAFAAEPDLRYDEIWDAGVYGNGPGRQLGDEHVGSVLADVDNWLLEDADIDVEQKEAAVCLDGEKYTSTNVRDTDEGALNYLD